MIKILQDPHGNCYLFIDNNVFMSSYNSMTNCVITTQLDLTGFLNDWEKEQIKLNIGEILPDGFDYVVVVHSYGTHSIYDYNNLKKALDHACEYYEDNGFAHIYTNNPNVTTKLTGGNVFFLDNPKNLEYPYSSDIAQVLSVPASYDYYEPEEDYIAEDFLLAQQEQDYLDAQNESDLNALENQSPEQ